MRKPNAKRSTVLIVDDAPDIRDALCQYFESQGLEAHSAVDATDARKQIVTAPIDIVILDIMMPGEDGLSLCRWMAENTETPVILLTAMATDIDRIIGLEVGADDYVVKPFNPRELLARIRAVLRRLPDQQQSADNRIRSFDKWTHDPTQALLTYECGKTIKLTSAESRLLSVFLKKPNTVLKRGYLIDKVLGREEKAYDRAIDNTIARLRKKLEKEPANPELLVTEWGKGYKLSAIVRSLDQP